MIRIISIFMLILCLIASACSFFIPREKPDGNSLTLWMPGASSVQVLSDWNDWGGSVSAGGIINPVSGRMERVDGGIWSLDISWLPGGVYRYVFFVNGYKWTRDQSNPETAEYEGRIVSVVRVPD